MLQAASGEVDLLEIGTQPVVLVVEDNRSVREIIGRVLAAEGYTTHAAPNGVEGLEQFYLTLPDLVLLDVRMPEMDGWETLRRIRKVSNCPVIMLTVCRSTEETIRGLELGADDYVAKPFGLRELIARVSAVLRRTSLV